MHFPVGLYTNSFRRHMTSPLLQRCPPIIGTGARILILGACPNAHLPAKQQYYSQSAKCVLVNYQ